VDLCEEPIFSIAPSLRTCLKTEFKGGRLRFVASTHSQKTRMDGARCVCAGFEVGKSEFLDRFSGANALDGLQRFGTADLALKVIQREQTAV
jgi:hypothetical protein